MTDNAQGSSPTGPTPTPPTPIKSRADELFAVVETVTNMAEYIRKFERKQQAAEQSIKHKDSRIKELEKQNREYVLRLRSVCIIPLLTYGRLSIRNRHLEGIIDGRTVRR